MVEFSSLAGYESIKDEGNEIIKMILNKDEFIKKGARRPKGFLFYGDPGMGKTFFAKELIKKSNIKTYEISSAVATKEEINMDKLILKSFEDAEKADEALIFIDEIDKVAGHSRCDSEFGFGNETDELQKLLMQAIDKVDSNKVMIIATANYLDYLSEAFLRTGRFDRLIKFHYPTSHDREEIIKYYLKDKKLNKEFDLELAVSQTSGYSCSDIECIINESIINAINRDSDDISNNDFYKAARRIILKDCPDKYNNSKKSKYVACHEAGHVLASLLLNPEDKINASIISQGSSAGSTFVAKGNDESNYGFEELKKDCYIGLAGMLAVKVLYKKVVGGNGSDLDKVNSLIEEAAKNGILGINNVAMDMKISIREMNAYNSNRTLSAKKFYKIRAKFYKGCYKLLKKNKATLEKIANELLKKEELSHKELIDLMKSN